LKQSGTVASAHRRLAQQAEHMPAIATLHERVLWGESHPIAWTGG
jgi:hypothetical protein